MTHPPARPWLISARRPALLLASMALLMGLGPPAHAGGSHGDNRYRNGNGTLNRSNNFGQTTNNNIKAVQQVVSAPAGGWTIVQNQHCSHWRRSCRLSQHARQW